jgi:hypothetical protein
MKKKWISASAVIWFFTSLCGAEVFQDWSQLEGGKYAGVFADKDGSKVALEGVPGPGGSGRALHIQSDIVGWGGVWSSVKADLSHSGGVRFMAKASCPALLEVGLGDSRQVQFIATIRILPGPWKEFVLPRSLFKKTPYPLPGSPVDASLDFSEIHTLQFQPRTPGRAEFWIGSVSTVRGKAAPKTGIPAEKPGTVQDFVLLEKNAYGPFIDEKSGTTIGMELKQDGDGEGRLADFHYDIRGDGWCGYWMRAGEAWGGQDWRGAKAFSFTINSKEPITLELGFNDANQCAYVALAPRTQGKGWETVRVPFTSFVLNPYYQPPEAKQGVVQDLSHIEAFNIVPQTKGKHEFQLRNVSIQKK